jgi:uncharacterized protein YggE
MRMLVITWSLSLLIAALVSPATASVTQEHEEGKPPTLTVTGRGEVRVKPDLAVIRFGAAAQAEEAAAAQREVNAAMQRTLTAVKELGVPEEAIQTASISLQPVYAPRQRGEVNYEPRIIGYRASNTIQVRLADLARIGAVIDAGIKAGANQFDGITFSLEDDQAERRASLTAAVRDARGKAEAISSAMGMRIVGVQHAGEAGVGVVRPQMEGMRAARMAADVSTPVQPGEVRVDASVTITYLIAR